jgi:hypothetical protein
MKANKKIYQTIILVLGLNIAFELKAQTDQAFDKLYPKSLADERKPVGKMITGIGAGVNITIISGIKHLEACSDADFGTYKIELIWYDANDEIGKYMLNIMKDLKTNMQDRKSFFNTSTFDLKSAKQEDWEGGQLKYIANIKDCINSITGPTGKKEFTTKLKYFGLFENTTVKIDFDSKMKPETAKLHISKILEEVRGFDYSKYKNVSLNEQ